MSPPHDDIPAMAELRDALYEAAQREMDPAPRRSRVRRRGALAIALALLVAGGVAGAASLLSTGKPVKDVPGKLSAHQPAAPGALAVSVTLTDPVSKSTWGVAPYADRSGRTCALVGQLRGQRLGEIVGQTFRPYAAATGGACGDLRTQPFFGDERYFSSPAARTAIYGRAAPGLKTVRVVTNHRVHVARTGHGGTFLFLFAGRVRPADVRLSAP
jgi:hypothetical protein